MGGGKRPKKSRIEREGRINQKLTTFKKEVVESLSNNGFELTEKGEKSLDKATKKFGENDV